MFNGSIPAMITPFKNGAIDEDAYRALVSWQIQEGSAGLVSVGTTGETPTMSHNEHKKAVEICISEARGRAPVIAGTGSNSTMEAIELTRHAESAGASGVLVVTPYYNKPNQDGLYAHFKAIHDASDLPIVIYNIPGRSAVDMLPETMARLFELKNIVGVKDATGDLARVSMQRMIVGKDFCQLSGVDETALAFRANGGHGCISVTANVAPRLCSQMHAKINAGNYADALDIQDKLMPLHLALFMEPNPQPVKAALALLGKCEDGVRLPMVPASDKTRTALQKALEHADLL